MGVSQLLSCRLMATWPPRLPSAAVIRTPSGSAATVAMAVEVVLAVTLAISRGAFAVLLYTAVKTFASPISGLMTPLAGFRVRLGLVFTVLMVTAFSISLA